MRTMVQLGAVQADQVGFGYSPAQEAVLSLHVLTARRKYPLHIPWVAKARRRLSPALKAELDALALLWRWPVARFWEIRKRAPIQTFAQEMAALLQAPVADYARVVIRMALGEWVAPDHVFTSSSLQGRLLERTIAVCPQSESFVREFLADPSASRSRFAALLTAYWETCLAFYWPQVEAKLERELRHRQQILYQDGPFTLLDDLSPDVRVDVRRGNSVHIPRCRFDVRLDLDASDQLFLVPSYFAWPHLLVNDERPAMIMYPIAALQRQATPPPVPEELLLALRAAADALRLQILRLLGQRPRSTSELAGLLNVSEAGISKHLKLLQESGLITAQRDGYYVLYRTVPGRLQELAGALQNLTGPARE